MEARHWYTSPFPFSALLHRIQELGGLDYPLQSVNTKNGFVQHAHPSEV